MGNYPSGYLYFVTSYYKTGVERICYKGDDATLANRAYEKSVNNEKVAISTFYVKGKKSTFYKKDCDF